MGSIGFLFGFVRLDSSGLNVGKKCDTAWVRNNYMGKPKNLVEKPNGLRHTVWEASEPMGCVLMQMQFCLSVRSGDLDILYC